MRRYRKSAYWLVILSSWLWAQVATAALVLVDGGNQTIPAGSPSEVIVFRALDTAGNPLSGAVVNFTLIDASCNQMNSNLQVFTALTDAQGQAITALRANNTAGRYTLTATMADDPSQIAGTGITVSGIDTVFAIDGVCQTVGSGQNSNPIVFRVVNANNQLASNVTVNFTLVNSVGITISNGVTVSSAISDAQGLVRTQAIANQKLGTYYIVASLANNPSKTGSAGVKFLAGEPALISSLTSDFRLPAGQSSGNVVFKLTDAYGNAVTNRNLNFSVQTPTGQLITTNVSPANAVTNENGEARTRFTAPETQGAYRLIATLANSTISGSVMVNVVSPLLALPSLGFSTTLKADGTLLSTSATFSGGIAVNGGAYTQQVEQVLSDTVVIEGSILVQEEHIGATADIVVVAAYTPLPIESSATYFFMLKTGGAIVSWSLSPATLEPFINDVSLASAQEVKMYTGAFVGTGLLQVFFGYRLTDGTVVFNGEMPIRILINP
ncbi:Ig-like domain-containing protein [Beggiatoa alba B18LD]|uniref:Ig-like domain-containing protein n=1 Tax=Beggiatoa alba B18LD TaxID=395493 RepID=I3CH40_9GAMM|nr:Ig-like domain-containing protein [Beggiatoa alba]EIJ42933.1 Ig-like domain-containing protein [Beggiatoa alba B18LD]